MTLLKVCLLVRFRTWRCTMWHRKLLSQPSRLVCPKDGSSTFIRNVLNYLTTWRYTQENNIITFTRGPSEIFNLKWVWDTQQQPVLTILLLCHFICACPLPLPLYCPFISSLLHLLLFVPLSFNFYIVFLLYSVRFTYPSPFFQFLSSHSIPSLYMILITFSYTHGVQV
jgi:hypothetical protein